MLYRDFNLIPTVEFDFNASGLLPELIDQDLPTSQTLPLIHTRIVDSIPLGSIPDGVRVDAERHLLRKCGIAEVQDLVADSRRSMMMAFANRAKLDVSRSGDLRQYGQIRPDAAAEWKPLFAPHFMSFDEAGPGGGYVGLSDGLDEMYQLICSRYDEIKATLMNNDNIDEKLRCLVYLQFWGAAVLHPFWDANGRAFNAQLVLGLNNLGFPVTNFPQLGEFSDLLSGNVVGAYGGQFLVAFLKNAGIGILNADDARRVYEDAAFHDQYMLRLREAMNDGVEIGIDQMPHITMESCMQSAVFALKMYLSREGFISYDFYTENEQTFRDSLNPAESVANPSGRTWKKKKKKKKKARR